MSHPQRRTTRLALTALVAGGLGLGLPLLQASAEPSDATVCTEAGNVWVHVETDDVVEGGCATDFATGIAALASAGFDVEASSDGFLTTINGEPSDRGAEDWWSYAHSDAELSGWEFYEVGATQSEPAAGSIEGWRLMHTFDQSVSTLPTTAPAELLAEVEPTPSPSATPSPTASPSATATPTPSVAPTPRPALPKTGN